jgi:hypothetical protein
MCLFEGLRRRTVVILHEGRDKDWADSGMIVPATGGLKRVRYSAEVFTRFYQAAVLVLRWIREEGIRQR